MNGSIDRWRDLHDTAGKTGTCITSLKGLLIAALAEVVSTGVDDEASTNDGVRAVEGDDLVCRRLNF